jgi:hypothetical protein
MVKSVKAIGMTIQEKSGQEMTILNNTSLTRTCPVPPKRNGRGPFLPAGIHKQEGTPYERNFLPGKSRLACPVLTRWAGASRYFLELKTVLRISGCISAIPPQRNPSNPFSSSPCGKTTNSASESKTQQCEVSMDSNTPSPFSVNHVCQKAW